MEGKRIRVNGEFIREHKGETVTIIGQVMDKDSDPLTIRTTDGKTISIHKNSFLKPERFNSPWVEITGKVAADISIEEEHTIPVKSAIDAEAWNQLVKIIHKHEENLF
jgi:hypothetical protein